MFADGGQLEADEDDEPVLPNPPRVMDDEGDEDEPMKLDPIPVPDRYDVVVFEER